MRPEVGTYRGCTATLIHREFILSAEHCASSLDAAVQGQATFTIDATPALPIVRQRNISSAWMLPHFPNFPLRAGAALNSDILLARLSSPVTDFAPAKIDASGVSFAGTIVSVFGFGKFATSAPDACRTAPSDGAKRAVDFSWGVPWAGGTGAPWPVCAGDSGGPTFRGLVAGGGELLTVTSNPNVAGSAVHYREEIYEQMRWMFGTRWVAGTFREGVALGGPPVLLSPGHTAVNCETGVSQQCELRGVELQRHRLRAARHPGPLGTGTHQPAQRRVRSSPARACELVLLGDQRRNGRRFALRVRLQAARLVLTLGTPRAAASTFRGRLTTPAAFSTCCGAPTARRGACLPMRRASIGSRATTPVLFGARGASFYKTSAKEPKDWAKLPSPAFPKPDNVMCWASRGTRTTGCSIRFTA
jgi:hypothetical protein